MKKLLMILVVLVGVVSLGNLSGCGEHHDWHHHEFHPEHHR